MKLKSLPISLLLIFFFLSVNSCVKDPITGRRDLMLMTESQEIAMGQQSDPEVAAFFGVYDDAKLQNFINEKGQAMAAVCQRPSLKYQFKIVDSPVVNAFAVPGGYVYFTRGIMAHLNNEAEFAGVLGHEIGHIAARHSAKQYTKSMLAQIGLVAGSALSPTFAQYANLAQQGVGLLFLKFGRDDESQADRLGVEYSSKVGYDAREMGYFFSTLDRLSTVNGAAEVPTFLSTHPNPVDRERKVGKLALDWREKIANPQNLKVSRDSYLRMIDGIIYGEDPKQGFVENNVFYHPVLKFQFPVPAQWVVQNTPQQVQMGDKDGNAVIMFTLAEGNSLDNAAQSLLQKYQLTLRESRRETVNGLSAIAMIADQQAQQTQGQQAQQGVRTLVYLIQYGGNIYTMIGATSQKYFSAYGNTFQSTMQGFAELKDPEKLMREPERVRIKTVEQTAPLSTILSFYKIPDKRLEEVAVMNGMKLDQTVAKGTLIKVLEQNSGPVSVKR
jgi:predicted Zn-dependent protease